MNVTRRVAASCLLATGYLLGQSNALDQEWSVFLNWVKAQRPGAFRNQSEIFPAYQKNLVGGGMAAVDAEALAARLQNRAKDDPEWTAVNFNRVYSQPGNQRYQEGIPNAFLVETARQLRPGRALDLGMGEGRNAIYLAKQGWDVTGLELSDVAVTRALERSKAGGVRIDARLEDVYKFDFGIGRWDLVCLMYFVIPEGQPGLYQRIVDGLKPGGYVIAEGLGNPPMETLQRAWAKWEPTKLRLMRLEYLVGLSDWSSTPGAFGRLLLQKPA